MSEFGSFLVFVAILSPAALLMAVAFYNELTRRDLATLRARVRQLGGDNA